MSIFNKKYFLISIACLLAIFLILEINKNEPNKILIYNDIGTSKESVAYIKDFLGNLVNDKYEISLIKASDIKNNILDSAKLLVIPGGADLPYVKKLNGDGNAKIRKFVENGGSFLGICAGAYYASSEVVFDEGGEIEVIGLRELKFYPGSSIGPILAKYDYKANKGARAANIGSELGNFVSYYNGGGYFKDVDKFKEVMVIGTYKDKNDLPAIIETRVGKGKAILSAVHFEYDGELLDKNDEYLHDIIFKLKESDNERIRFGRNILSKLGL